MGDCKTLEPPDPGSGGETSQQQLGEKMQRFAFHPNLDDDGKILDNGKEAR